jgi:hypothetical protein
LNEDPQVGVAVPSISRLGMRITERCISRGRTEPSGQTGKGGGASQQANRDLHKDGLAFLAFFLILLLIQPFLGGRHEAPFEVD